MVAIVITRHAPRVYRVVSLSQFFNVRAGFQTTGQRDEFSGPHVHVIKSSSFRYAIAASKAGWSIWTSREP